MTTANPGADASPWIALFDEKSPAYHSALQELRSLFLRVGFIVDKKRDTEATLRVYVRERLTYPLLNPIFVSRRRRGSGNRAFVEIQVLSKLTVLSNIHETLDRRLRKFAASPLVAFETAGEVRRPYFFHGSFLLPLLLQSGSDSLALDLNALEPGLRELLRFLD